MKSWTKRRPSPALVISIIALFVAMAGGAYAAKVAKNSVGASALKKNAVTSSKIQKNAVSSDKIAVGSINEGKLANPASSIRAWGRVAAAGTLSAGQNLIVAPDGTGRYCI
jgi:hypothetical protein